MSRNETLDDILLTWEELCEQGQEPSLPELCRDHPDLLPEVERRVAALRKVYRVPNFLPTLPTSATEMQTAPDRALQPNLADYEIQGTLGVGGMGKVFKARQRSLKR